MPIKLQGQRLPGPIRLQSMGRTQFRFLEKHSLILESQSLYSWESLARKAAWKQSASLATAQRPTSKHPRLSNHVKISMLPSLEARQQLSYEWFESCWSLRISGLCFFTIAKISFTSKDQVLIRIISIFRFIFLLDTIRSFLWPM